MASLRERFRWGIRQPGYLGVLAAFLVAAQGHSVAEEAVSQAISFNRDIRPILSENCFLCHGPDEENRSAGLRLDDRDAAIADNDGVRAIIPGNADQSELIHRIETTDPDDRMPPPDSERSLTAEQRKILRAWIDAGAPYERHWAFEPIRRPELPAIDSEDDALRNPIDHFILARLAKLGIGFSPEATPEKLARRVAFDLTGLPPTLEELDAFLADRSPDRFERYIDRLLERESYGERMASEWLDVARYSDTYGYQVDRDRFVWPWRDWVVEAFNGNLPYNEFITWQLAGDLLPEASDRQILATAFNRLHPQKVEGGSVPEEFRIEYVADRTQTVATAFMGLTLECARCHDHKYDPLKQEEYYQLTSFFANIDEAGLYSYFTDSVPTPTMHLATEKQKQTLVDAKEKLSALERAYAESRQSASEAPFDAWLTGRQADESGVQPGVGFFNFETFEDGKIPNLQDSEKPATSSASNQLVEGREGRGLALTGDDEVDLKVGNFKRSQPFSFGLWLKTPELFERTVVFHRSRAWTDAGSRGYQLLLEDGKPSFSLIHFWPGNAIRVRSQEPLPVGEFVHLGITYDGSSRADGVQLFLNGEAMDTESVQDLLTKNITGGGHDQIAIGARFRDIGFKAGVVDEFHVFDRELSSLEVRAIYHDGALATALQTPANELSEAQRAGLRDYYLAQVNPEVAEARAALKKQRDRVCQLEDGMKEIMVMKERSEPRTSYLLTRGGYENRAKPVANETPAALPAFPESAPRNRLGLAAWLTDPDHPLTARVVVNRYWQMIFGRGLVATPEDFGSQGKVPSHPKLLDWLAADFVANGWNVKRLLRQMVTSTTYRQSSATSPEMLELDPENLFLGRAPRYRLAAEMIRDNALATSGLLVRKVGGAPVKPYEVAMSFKPSKVDKGDGLYRRSLYTYWKRTGPAPVMMALDASKRDVCSVKRETTATPLQSFVFMNDPQFVEAARHLADRLMQSGSPSDAIAPQLEKLFRILTSRYPGPAEKEVLRQLYDEQYAYFEKDPERVKAFLSTGASEIDEQDQQSQLAALAVVASAVLSHDECIMKR